MKTSRIKHATGNGTWESPSGLMYSFIVDFENGDQCIFNAKTKDAYSMGMSVDYELTGKSDRNQTPYARKSNREFKGWNYDNNTKPAATDDRQKSIEIQMSFKAATEFVISKDQEITHIEEAAKYIYDCIQDAKRSY